MQIEVLTGSITVQKAEALIVNLFEGVTTPAGATGAVDAALGGQISRVVAGGDFKGKLDQTAVLYPDGKKCFATIDIDCLNAGLCPGTGTLEADGLAAHQLVDLLKIVARKYKVLGLDLVEVNPLPDPAKLTGMVAARVIVEFLGAIFR